jgi:hypothetical protein
MGGNRGFEPTTLTVPKRGTASTENSWKSLFGDTIPKLWHHLKMHGVVVAQQAFPSLFSIM